MNWPRYHIFWETNPTSVRWSHLAFMSLSHVFSPSRPLLLLGKVHPPHSTHSANIPTSPDLSLQHGALPT